MPVITLPDGSQREYDKPVSVLEVAQSIGAALAKAAVAGKVGDRFVDVSHVVDHDEAVSIVTLKDDMGLEILRHSCAHLLAHAVKELYPEVQVTIGPVIEDGFYYDFYYPPGFTIDDLGPIEKKMQELAAQKFPVSRHEVSRDQATKLFKDMGEGFKVKIIEDLPEEASITYYKQSDFIDLCRGPHLPSTGFLKAFKLTKVSGAYWRGDANNETLQRIYGTVWPDKKTLNAYLQRIEEAKKRDHRKIAKKLDLYHMQDIAPGMIFWHADGWTLYQLAIAHIREYQKKYDYQEINTPLMVDSSLWEASGHLEKFGDEMFAVEADHHVYAMKPMNCPCHVQVFNQGIKSYRDLPYRLAEFGRCHRNEPSGTLHGLMRVRSFTQDDGHIFCTEDQVGEEVLRFIDQAYEIYKDYGFDEIDVKLSTRPEKRVGSDEVWDKAEQMLTDSLNEKGLDWSLLPGEGAFYGPKIEFALKDCLGRVWQLGTMQVDFSMPGRLGAEYIAEDGSKKTPVMLHRAVLGSLERFLGILLEHHAGNLPAWLAPVQVAVMTITGDQAEYSANIMEMLKKVGIRAIEDLRNEKIGFKIREHSMKRVPYLIVLGQKEVEQQQVAVRTQKGDDLGAMSIESFLAMLQEKIDNKE